MRFERWVLFSLLSTLLPLDAALAPLDWRTERLLGNVTEASSFAMQLDGAELDDALKMAHGPSLLLYPRWEFGETLTVRVESVRQRLEDVTEWTARFRDAPWLGLEPELRVEKVGSHFLLLASVSQSELERRGPFLLIPHPGGKGTSVSPFAQWSVVRAEVSAAKCDEIGWLSFSSDGQHLAQACRKGQEWSLWVDGQERGRFARVESFAFAPKGVRFAAGVQDGDGMRVVDETGKKGREFSSVSWPVFSPDGQVVAYSGQEETSWVMVVGGKPGARFDRVGRAVFRPDGREVAYTAERAGSALLIRGEQIVKSYERVNWPVYSPDGKRFAFAASKDGQGFVVLDGAEQVKVDEAEWPVFSPDGKALAYRARDGASWGMVVNGERETRFSWVGPPVFSPSGHTLAFAAQLDQKWVVVLDHQVSPPFDWVGLLRFDPDGRALGFAALVGNALWWKRLSLPSKAPVRGK